MLLFFSLSLINVWLKRPKFWPKFKKKYFWSFWKFFFGSNFLNNYWEVSNYTFSLKVCPFVTENFVIEFYRKTKYNYKNILQRRIYKNLIWKNKIIKTNYRFKSESHIHSLFGPFKIFFWSKFKIIYSDLFKKKFLSKF